MFLFMHVLIFVFSNFMNINYINIFMHWCMTTPFVSLIFIPIIQLQFFLILRSIISYSCLEFSEFLVVTCSSFVGIHVQNIIFSSFFRNIGLEHHQLFCFGRGISNSNRWKSFKSYFNIPIRCGRPKTQRILPINCECCLTVSL